MTTPITLTHGAQTLALPGDLIWSDELAWSPVAQQVEYSIEGALVIDRLVKLAGRPITLAGHASRAWVARGTLKTLQAWASEATEAVFTLRLAGAIHRVIFDLSGGSAVSGEPVQPWGELVDEDAYFNVTLKFLEV